MRTAANTRRGNVIKRGYEAVIDAIFDGLDSDSTLRCLAAAVLCTALLSGGAAGIIVGWVAWWPLGLTLTTGALWCLYRLAAGLPIGRNNRNNNKENSANEQINGHHQGCGANSSRPERQ